MKKTKTIHFILVFVFFHKYSMFLHCKKYKLKIQIIFKYLSAYRQGTQEYNDDDSLYSHHIFKTG